MLFQKFPQLQYKFKMLHSSSTVALVNHQHGAVQTDISASGNQQLSKVPTAVVNWSRQFLLESSAVSKFCR